ncbi:MAG: hypothetical protein QOF64_350, partial [Candidatus Binatota bacterium]|nr:hypothetical protein [Candidatus Binatota bacterium]
SNSRLAPCSGLSVNDMNEATAKQTANPNLYKFHIEYLCLDFLLSAYGQRFRFCGRFAQ